MQSWLKLEKMSVAEMERSLKFDLLLVLAVFFAFSSVFFVTLVFLINIDFIMSLLFGTMYLGIFLIVAVISLFFKRMLLFIKKNMEG